jgi:hypothetical protein
MHKYGVLFFNENTNEEIHAFFFAENWLRAKDYAENFEIADFEQKEIIYLTNHKDEVHYNVKLETVAQNQFVRVQ